MRRFEVTIHIPYLEKRVEVLDAATPVDALASCHVPDREDAIYTVRPVPKTRPVTLP